MKEFIKMSTLLHNQPTQNIWISALETFLLKKQVGIMDPLCRNGETENIAEVKDIPVRSGLWLAEQIQAGISSAGAGVWQDCAHLMDTAAEGKGLLLSSASENEDRTEATWCNLSIFT